METIFSRILSGEIPSHRVFDNDWVFAFLDIQPVSRGHTLVIPKEPAATLDQLSDDSAAALGRALPRICRAVQTITGCKDYNVLQNNGAAAFQSVPHVHFHIIPKPDEIQGLGLRWPAKQLDNEQGSALAEQLRRTLER